MSLTADEKLTKRELFVLRAVSYGRGVVNGRTWESLLRKELVSGTADLPKITRFGRRVVNEMPVAAPEKHLPKANENSGDRSKPKQEKRGITELGFMGVSLALVVCLVVIWMQHVRLQDAQRQLRAVSAPAAEQANTAELAGMLEGRGPESSSASRAETNAKVLEIQKHLDARIQALQSSKQPRR